MVERYTAVAALVKERKGFLVVGCAGLVVRRHDCLALILFFFNYFFLCCCETWPLPRFVRSKLGCVVVGKETDQL